MIEEFKLKDNRVVEIRIITKEDYEIDDNYEFVYSWLNKVNKYLYIEFKPENLERNKEWYYEMLDTGNFFVIGAIFKGKIIGTTDLRINPEVEKVKHVGSWGIAIHQDFHNQGLGMRLLTHIETLAREKGLIRLEADFYEGNTAAKTLYVEKMNYEIEGIHKKAVKLTDGTFTNKISIGKLLD